MELFSNMLKNKSILLLIQTVKAKIESDKGNKS